MTCIIPGIALVNNFDGAGQLMRGANLRIFQADTSTAVIAYKDPDLTAGQEHTWPIRADSSARLPMFWVPPGRYRVRLSSADLLTGVDTGHVAYDVLKVDAVSAATTGGTGPTPDPGAIVGFKTGWISAQPFNTSIADWVRCNGLTIGSGNSVATERANDDTLALYRFLWGGYAQVICPVTGGRGASADADFSANKPIKLFDARMAGFIGMTNMGNVISGFETNVPNVTGNSTLAGSIIGASTHTNTIAEMARHNHGGLTTLPGPHVHSYERYLELVTVGTGVSGEQTLLWRGAGSQNTGGMTSPAYGIPFEGTGVPHNNTQRSIVGTWYQKL